MSSTANSNSMSGIHGPSGSHIRMLDFRLTTLIASTTCCPDGISARLTSRAGFATTRSNLDGGFHVFARSNKDEFGQFPERRQAGGNNLGNLRRKSTPMPLYTQEGWNVTRREPDQCQGKETSRIVSVYGTRKSHAALTIGSTGILKRFSELFLKRHLDFNIGSRLRSIHGYRDALRYQPDHWPL